MLLAVSMLVRHEYTQQMPQQPAQLGERTVPFNLIINSCASAGIVQYVDLKGHMVNACLAFTGVYAYQIFAGHAAATFPASMHSFGSKTFQP